MATIDEIKEQEVTGAPLLLFECQLPSGDTEYWSTQKVSVEVNQYEARVLRHNVFEMRAGGEDGIDAASKLSVTLANADSHFSEIERSAGWKGARLTVRFAFFDFATKTAAAPSRVVFRGIANPPDEITESAFRLTFGNRLSPHRVQLPEVRIQKRCPWMFPATAEQRAQALDGGAKGKYNALYRCGYSPDQTGGAGTLNGTAPFEACDYTKACCEERGMYRADASQRTTARFGGVQYVPPSIEVRSHGESGRHVSTPVENAGRYNDPAPLVYGTAWYQPPIVFARNDGNLTRMEVLLGLGEMQGVLKVLVSEVEIPAGRDGADMTATGWYKPVTAGSRNGSFNPDFADGSGNPLGDPYGSIGVLSVVVPNRINDAKTLPKIQVLAEGLKLPIYGTDGAFAGETFSNNPAWVLLDLLRRSGWTEDEIDLSSFARAATHCAELVPASDLNGNPVSAPRFQCNLAIRKRRSAADVIRGVRNCAGLLLGYNASGQLEVRAEASIATQQPDKREGTNSTEKLNDGWPAYEFGDGSNGFGGILRRENGEPSLRVWSKMTADSPNRYTIEFQDVFNDYQQDSLSLVDIDDVIRGGQEVTAALAALGVPSFDQAARIARLQLDKSVRGNTYVDFETSVRGIGLRPGDLITITYLKEGWTRQPFRVLRIAPGGNWRTTAITAQIHFDEWYEDGPASGGRRAGRQPGSGTGTPRPLGGSILNAEGWPEFEVEQTAQATADGGVRLLAQVRFTAPARPQAAAAGVPLVSLAAAVNPDGGTLEGGTTYYYALSAVDAAGAESGLSFVVRAAVAAGGNTNSVTLSGLSFTAGTQTFRVYRGPNPTQLYRIATDVTPAGQFTDTGATADLSGPPDENYDHANFYWRLEMQPETAATIHSATTLGNGTMNWPANEHRGATVRITAGKGQGQERPVISNTATTLTVAPSWVVTPDSTSRFVVAESGWQFGALAYSSPVEFEIPNREGATLHISGRAANVNDRECAYELSPLTRWTITGAGGTGQDEDVPGEPVFSLALAGRGSVELRGVGFEELTNTRTISAGTLTLHYWNELQGATGFTLTGAAGADADHIDLTPAGSASAGEALQIEGEVLTVLETANGGLRYLVERGSCGSTAAAHSAGSAVHHLSRRTIVAPFPARFFGSPASGAYALPIHLADARIAAAQLFVTNARGNSPTSANCYTGTEDYGLRTLAGGQLSLQVDGYLAVETDAVPALQIDAARSVADAQAMVSAAASGAAIEVRLKRNGAEWCRLLIPEGETVSEAADGAVLEVLEEGDRLGMDILTVGTTEPGRDLTVTVRL